MEHNDHQELGLEEIVKEFSDPDLEEIVREFSDPDLEDIIQEFTPAPSKKPAADLSGDTVRLDQIHSSLRKKSVTSQTQRFNPLDTPPDPEPEPEPVAPPKEPQVEPFSESWEPEYEEPMGNYPIREPIRFESRDKLRLLREKLVQGPEKRYYELAQTGTATVRLSAFILFMLFLVSAGVSLAFDWGYIGTHRIKMVVFCQLLAVLVAALLSHGRLLEGLASLFLRGRFTLHTLLAFTCLVCCIDALACLGQERISCCSIFCLQTAMAQWAACHARRTEMNRMDTLRKASQLTALVKIDDYYQNLPGYVTSEGQLEDFWDHYRAPSGPEKALSLFGAIGAGLSLLLSIVMGLRDGFFAGVQVLTAALLVVMPATALISMRRPETILEKRLHALGTVLCGWQGVKAVEKQVVFPVTHEDLFPGESIDLNGMKFYGNIDPDMVLCYAGSLISHEGGSLTAIFDPLMASRYIRHAAVEEFGSYPGGLSALVDGEPVAVGTLEFMGQMEISIPKEAQIAGAVYAAVDGSLCGVFAIRYARSKAASGGLRNLCGNGHVSPVFVSGDFLLTGRFLREKLKVNARRLVYPDAQTRLELAAQAPDEEPEVVALTVRKGLAQRSFAITGALALRSAQKGGAWIHIIGGSLGLAAVAVLALIGATELLTPGNLLLYGLVWMLPGWLITEWTRYI